MASSPAAGSRDRAPRRFWFDPRFAVGIVLIIASVLGVVLLVGGADDTEEVWAARETLSPGDSVDADDLIVREVRLGPTAERYLAGDALLDEPLVVTRSVAAGELVPIAAVGAAESVRVASVVVETTGRLPRSVVAGSVVDVWTAKETDAGGFGPPAVLVGSATVVRLLETDGLIVNEAAVGVEVLVPRTKTAVVLEALANGDSLSLVPVSVPVDAAGDSAGD